MESRTSAGSIDEQQQFRTERNAGPESLFVRFMRGFGFRLADAAVKCEHPHGELIALRGHVHIGKTEVQTHTSIRRTYRDDLPEDRLAWDQPVRGAVPLDGHHRQRCLALVVVEAGPQPGPHEAHVRGPRPAHHRTQLRQLGHDLDGRRSGHGSGLVAGDMPREEGRDVGKHVPPGVIADEAVEMAVAVDDDRLVRRAARRPSRGCAAGGDACAAPTRR